MLQLRYTGSKILQQRHNYVATAATVQKRHNYVQLPQRTNCATTTPQRCRNAATALQLGCVRKRGSECFEPLVLSIVVKYQRQDQE